MTFAKDLATALSDLVDNLVFLSEVDSTHAQAIRLMNQLDEEDIELNATVIIAERQTHGVGRGHRRWESPGGGLYISWIRSGLSHGTVSRLPMIAAAAAHRAVVELGIDRAGIKWPNDILVDGEKLAGILVHARLGTSHWATVGLGVNLHSIPALDRHAAQPATALSAHIDEATHTEWCRAVVVSYITSLTQSITDPETGIEAWRRSLIHTPGDAISVRMASGEIHTGIFNGLTQEGFLKLGQPGGERIVTGGDVIEFG